MDTENDIILRIPARYRDTWDGFLSLAISAIESTDESTWSEDERELLEALREDKWITSANTVVRDADTIDSRTQRGARPRSL